MRKKRFATLPKAPASSVREGAAKEGKPKRMARGTVKWFDEDKGYGFITPEEGGEDLFVHYSNIEGEGFRSLEEGAKVSYEPARGRKGPEAQNVSNV